MRYMRQILAGNIKPARMIGSACGKNNFPHAIRLPLSARRRRSEYEAFILSLDRDNRLIGIDLQIKLRDDRSQIRQIFLARGLGLISRHQRHAGNRDSLVGAEKSCLRRKPGDRVANLLRIKVNVIDAGALQCDRQLNSDRPGADDGQLGCFHVRKLCYQKPTWLLR